MKEPNNRQLVMGVVAIVACVCLPGKMLAQDDGSGSVGIVVERIELEDCPEGFGEQRYFITYARSNAQCETVISCTNLDTQNAEVAGQFFFGFGSDLAGSATLTLRPGDTLEIGTAQTDPQEIFVINADANTGRMEGKGRVCSTTKKMACHATLVCLGGLQRITIIEASQAGD